MALAVPDDWDDPISDLARFWAELPDEKRHDVWQLLDARSRALIEAAEERDAQGAEDVYFPEARDKQKIPLGDWLIWLIMAGRGFGKALALDTPIPTPTGWTTMGEVHVGDELLDERGVPCQVTFTTGIQHDRTCHRVRFDDGSSIVADAEHRWLTWTKAARKAHGRAQVPTVDPAVRTTAEIAVTLRVGPRGETNHSIANAAPLVLPDAKLPIDAYTFGMWLGDGSSKCAEITISDADSAEILGLVAEPVTGPLRRNLGAAAATYPIGGKPYRRDPTTGQMVANDSMHSRLRELGVLGNKHIPAVYLRASVPQRRALLAGLLDSDGSVTPGGHVEFCNTSPTIIKNVAELVVSLGYKAATYEGRATIDGRDCGPKWRVCFTPREQVFHLARKAARIPSGRAQATRTRHRFIIDAEPVTSVPVRCITVDSPSHLFLAGRTMVPTHNTRTGAEWIVEETILRPSVYLIVAPTFAAGRDICVEGRGDNDKPSGVLSVLERRGWTLVHAIPDGATRDDRLYTWNRSMGELRLSSGGFIKVLSAEQPERIRGWNASGAWADELGSWDYPDAFDQLRFTLRIGDYPRLVITTTPRPKPMIRDIVARANDGDVTVIVVKGSMSENAENLSAAARAELENKYGGTRLGRQELEGELLEDVEGALWQAVNIHHTDTLPKLRAVAIGIDPSTWGEDTGNAHKHVGQGIETGMVVAGITYDYPAKVFILDDLSGRFSPDEWARKAIGAYWQWLETAGEVFIVPETNAGGGMVTATIRLVDPRARIFKENGRAGVHAAKGKRARAEPVAALYEQPDRVFHLGEFDILEEQMTSWDSSESWSPDRIDALVWAVTSLKPWAASPATATGPPSSVRIAKPKPGARSIPRGGSITQLRGPIRRPRAR